MEIDDVARKLREVVSKPAASVLLEIYRITNANLGEYAYYSKLVEKCDYSKTTTAKALAELEGLSLVTSKWEKIPASSQYRWVRSYSVESEAIPYVADLARTLKIRKQK